MDTGISGAKDRRPELDRLMSDDFRMRNGSPDRVDDFDGHRPTIRFALRPEEAPRNCQQHY